MYKEKSIIGLYYSPELWLSIATALLESDATSYFGHKIVTDIEAVILADKEQEQEKQSRLISCETCAHKAQCHIIAANPRCVQWKEGEG